MRPAMKTAGYLATACLVLWSSGFLNAQQGGLQPGSGSGAAPVNVVNPLPLPIDPSRYTHIGRPVRDHVALRYSIIDGFKRILPDMSEESDTFVVPSGMVFVLTDVSWHSRVLNQSPNVQGGVELGLATGSGGGFRVVLHSWGVSDSVGRVGDAQHLTAGVVLSAMPNVRFVSLNSIEELLVQGYLMPAN